MLISIGRRTLDEGVEALLRACHARIRHFCALAERAAVETTTHTDQRREAFEASRRYFADAFLLHVEDEDESIAPRLIGEDPALDETLQTMRREHDDHDAVYRALLEALSRAIASPDDPLARDQVASAACAFAIAVFPHLEHEEATLLPAVAARIDTVPSLQREVLEEFRRRREPQF